MGNYIVDFFCPKAKLIIELDGSQHLRKKQKREDKLRETYFEKEGFKIIRFLDSDVLKNLDGVVYEIYKYVSRLNST